MTTTTVHIHDDWATPGFDLPPLAPATGPFVRRDILRTWHRHRGTQGEVRLVEGQGALLPLFATDGTIRFLGEADLTDYHSPLGDADSVRRAAAAFFGALDPGTRVELNSLPAEAADPLEEALRDAGIVPERRQHEVAAVLALPSDFDEWLAAIGKKERHEVRRKRRRFDDDLGSPHLVRCTGEAAVARFAEMHRLAAGDKGEFMTDGMEVLFHDLHRSAGAVIDMLESHDGERVAAAFGFEDETGYYLYNSAYDPKVRHASPGIVMLASLIERAIDAGKHVFDFLKGDEPYKFRHGAAPRPLFELTGTAP